MDGTPTLRQRFTGALTLSIVAHLAGALLFGAAFGHAIQAAPANDVQGEISFRLTIERHPKTRPKPPRAVALPKRELARHAPAIAVATSAATPDDLHRVVASNSHPEPIGTAGRQAPIAMPDFRMTAAPPPTYSPTSAPASAPPPPTVTPAARGEIPNGGWGQNFERPIVADDGALAEVRDRFRALGAVKIDVDETGHATRITILARQLAPQIRTELEQALLGLRFVAAECNGLRCAGSLELRL